MTAESVAALYKRRSRFPIGSHRPPLQSFQDDRALKLTGFLFKSY